MKLLLLLLLLLLIQNSKCQQKLLASDGISNDEFGYSVSISDDYAIVGAPYKDSNKGAAYIYMKTSNDWIEVKKLVASDGAYNDYFGSSVSISGEYAVVGAVYKDSSRGASYIYMNISNDWIEVKKLVTSDAAVNDYFGYSVSISGEYVIVGANGKYSSRGVSYIYMNTSNDWIEVKKLSASDGVSNDQFGRSVSISGEYVIVGANGKDSQRGTSYIYMNTSNDWIEVKKLLASDGVSGDYFGTSVSISGEYVIVGAPAKDASLGAAYIYMNTSNDWIEVRKLSASDGVRDDAFGKSVSISGEYAIVGTPYKDSLRGAAYIYMNTSNDWIEVKKLLASNSVNNDQFGYYVSISGEYALVGAYGKDSARGVSYMYLNCSAGSEMSGMNCTECLPGTYSSAEYSVDCLSCPVGSYCPNISTITPITCSLVGSYCPSNSSSENLCPAGYYCINPSTITDCPARQDCEEGSINPNTPCPAGYYCEYGKAKQACITNGYYCDEGSSSEKPCSTSCPPSAPYVVSECTHKSNLRCGESIIGSFSVPWTLLGIVSGFAIIVLIMSKLLGRKFPQSKSIRLFKFIFAIVDCASDVIFIWHVHPISYKAFIGSIGVFVLSILIQGGYLSYLVLNWMNDDAFQSFVGVRTLWFGLVFVVSCTNIESILFLSSKCFALDMLSAPLSHDDELLVERGGSLSVIFETIPQLVIQLYIALDQKELSGPIGFALLISVIQVCVAISKYIWICVLHCKKKKKKYGTLLDVDDEALHTELVDNSTGDINNDEEALAKRRRELEGEMEAIAKRHRELEEEVERIKAIEAISKR